MSNHDRPLIAWPEPGRCTRKLRRRRNRRHLERAVLALSWLCGAADLRCARGLVARVSSRACVPDLRAGAVAGARCLPCRERHSERADLSAIASAPSWTCTGDAMVALPCARFVARERHRGHLLALYWRCCARAPGSSLVIYRAWAPSRARCPGAVASAVASAQSWPGTGLCCLLASGIYCAGRWAPSRACCLRPVLAMRRARALGLSLGGRGESDRRVIVADPHRGHVTLENLLREGGVARCHWVRQWVLWGGARY